MKNILILLFFISFCIYFSQQKVYNITIKEGTTVIDIEGLFSVSLNFTAEDNGTYVFIFEDIANIIEATGDIHEDIYINTDPYHRGYQTQVYAQNFSYGDYVIADYPYKTRKNPNFSIIKIQKIDAYFRFF